MGFAKLNPSYPLLGFFVLLGFCMTSCAAVPPAPRITYVTPSLTRAQNAFSIDLYGQLAHQPGNFFFAPYSVSTGLGMVYAGAGSMTAGEIAKALHLDDLAAGDAGNLHTAYLKDFAALPPFGDTKPDGSKFETANVLWGASHYHFNVSYIAAIKSDFGGDLRPVDFADPDGASSEINAWVATQTHGKIPKIISPDKLNASTRLVLTNAVYFKAGWDQPFCVCNTSKAPFEIRPGNDVLADTMNMTSDFGYAADNRVQILVLDYRYGDTSMVVVLPKAKEGLSAVETRLALPEINALLAAKQFPLVHVSLPKFSADFTFDLIPALQALGVHRLFDRRYSDLTGIAVDRMGPLYVNFVVHKAHLDVDEVGTEAAAVTLIGGGVSASAPAPVLGPPPVPIPFIANHPFLYFIRDNASGQILFMGRVEDPTE